MPNKPLIVFIIALRVLSVAGERRKAGSPEISFVDRIHQLTIFQLLSGCRQAVP
jgi:hypothetical protein